MQIFFGELKKTVCNIKPIMQFIILGIVLIISSFVLFFGYKLLGTSVLMFSFGTILILYETLTPDTRHYSCIDSTCVPKTNGVFGNKQDCLRICGTSA